MDKDMFLLFKKDIEGKKQTVLFIGAGVNFTPNQNLLWGDLLNYLMEHATGKLKALPEERKIITEALMDERSKHETKDRLKLRLAANQTFSSEVKASIIKQLLGNLYTPFSRSSEFAIRKP